MHNHKANRSKADDIFRASKDPIELEKIFSYMSETGLYSVEITGK